MATRFSKNKIRMTDELRDKLIAVGKYDAVLERRDERVRKNCTGDNLHYALDEIAPEVSKALGLYVGFDDSVEPVKQELLDKIVSDAKRDRKACAGKNCSKGQAVEWAFVNAMVGDASAEDAPSLLAWTLYKRFKASPKFMDDMVEGSLLAQLKKEGEKDNRGADGFDGDEEYNILASLTAGGGE